LALLSDRASASMRILQHRRGSAETSFKGATLAPMPGKGQHSPLAPPERPTVVKAAAAACDTEEDVQKWLLNTTDVELGFLRTEELQALCTLLGLEVKGMVPMAIALAKARPLGPAKQLSAPDPGVFSPGPHRQIVSKPIGAADAGGAAASGAQGPPSVQYLNKAPATPLSYIWEANRQPASAAQVAAAAEAYEKAKATPVASAHHALLRIVELLFAALRATPGGREAAESPEFKYALDLLKGLLKETWGGPTAPRCDSGRANTWLRALHQTALELGVPLHEVKPDGEDHKSTLELSRPAGKASSSDVGKSDRYGANNKSKNSKEAGSK
jgi:hypothetical protein